MKKEQFSRFYNMETRWYDEDMLGHINHGTAVAYFEDARVRHAHDIGLFPYDTDKFPFIVASMTFNFLKQIKHPKNLTVGLKISRIGSKSFDYNYGLFMENDEECSISCNMTMVCFDFSNQKSVQVFDEIKKEFQGE
jgi:acyl-CoA thioester hydrolase